ncbi:MAG: PQQ-dependent sugar dehydrogenase [Elusimicrobia bacterium]|nr:PQQ-dependent sugar dehydrogenase [Elusimicrobiota bacterium]
MAALPKIALVLAAAFGGRSFERPLDLQVLPDGTGRLAVVEQGGKVWLMDGPDSRAGRLVLDLSGRTKASGERGFLGLAFHPRFKENGLVFAHYSDMRKEARSGERDHRSVVSRWHWPKGKAVVDPGSEAVVLTLDQPYSNHNGGAIRFGPDGFLYMGVGDGGSGGDPEGNGQNLGVLLGKLLRLDVDKPPYAVPVDNPFAGRKDARGEIWAYGLRNPWRFSFDRETGELWAGDVGQDELEEVDRIERGGNYGWKLFEGTKRYAPGEAAGLKPPALEYGRDVGGSITGGFVYRGKAIPALRGVYLYADYVSGRLRGARMKGSKAEAEGELLPTGLNVSSFGEDLSGELYLTAFDGKVYKLTTP